MMKVKDLFFREEGKHLTYVSFVQVKNSVQEHRTIEMPCSMDEIIAILLQAKREMTKEPSGE